MGRAVFSRGWPVALLAVCTAVSLLGTGAAIAMGLALFLAGFAHGAGDEQAGTLRPFALAPAAAYVVAGLAVAALFLALPLAGLTLFLLLSLWHFARSGRGDAIGRAAFACLAVGGSALLRMDETSSVFAALLGSAPPHGWMLALAATGAAGLTLSVATFVRGRFDAALAATLVAVALLHPVLAVGFAFAVGHAFPLQGSQIRRYGWRDVIAAQGPTASIALLGALAMAALVLSGHLPLPWAAALAFGMATPHMLSERLER